MKLRVGFTCLALLVPLAFLAGSALPLREDIATLVAQLKKDKDDADPKLVQQLGALRTREALTALLDLYDNTMGSIYMRREIVKVLGQFDNVPDAEQPALQRLTDVATAGAEPELRAMALDTLGTCSHMGKHFLKTIVDSAAEDDIRERAMEKLVRLATKEDLEFFEKVFKASEPDPGAKPDKKKDKPKKKDDPVEAQKKVNAVRTISELAFEQLAAGLPAVKLYEYARAQEKGTPDELEKWGIRRLALLELEKRKDKGLLDLAQQMYDDAQERGSNRGEAARIMAAQLGVKVAPRFLEDGRSNPGMLPEETRAAIAEQLAVLRDDATDKKLVKLVGKGKAFEQRFALRALRGYRDDKFAKLLAKEVEGGTKKAPPKENDPEYNDQRDLVLMTIELLGALKDASVVPELESVVEKCADQVVVAAAMDALGVIHSNDAAWLQKLEGLTANARQEVRNAALLTIGKTGDKKYVPLLAKALESDDWSTRNAALGGLEATRTLEAIGAIVARMEKETGLMMTRFADALWRLTGKPFRLAVTSWKQWWEREGATFTPITLSELSKVQEAEEMRRLKQTTKSATFFGIRIVSHRVIFIIDVSGSMAELTRSEYVGRQGKPRIQVAKEELAKCIDILEPESLFNIISFSGGVTKWLPGGVAQYGKSTKDEAKKHVAAMVEGGGTNLYDALKEAFADPDVDTIYLLSDGEPSAGEVTDQYEIRARVKQWNARRGVIINTIAVGGSFQILEWLAADTTGTHKKFQ